MEDIWIMDKEHVKGAADEAKGAVKDAAGKMMGDKSLQAEGKVDKAKGAAHQAADHIKALWTKITNGAMPLLLEAGRHRAIAGMIAFIVFVFVVAVGSVSVLMKITAGNSWLMLAKVLWGVWTIAVPLWFFMEYLGVSSSQDEQALQARADRLRELKETQEYARAVWAACAVVVGLLLFKGP
jgi:uncharacterized protein YjbJ (UPF0337 family)